MDWELELGGAQAAAIALAVVSGACLLGLIFWWSRQTRRHATEASTAEAVALHAAMVRLQDELPQLLRNMTGRLDAKMRALRDLIHEAGSTIEELRRLQAPAARNAESIPDPSYTAPRAVPSDSDPLLAPQSAANVSLDPGESMTTVRRTPDPTELRSQRYAHVYSLADDGLGAAEISAETGMHRGEVELVLSLRRKRVRADRGGRPEPTHVVSSPEEVTV